MGGSVGSEEIGSVDVQLNVVPFIDLMSCLTAFLLVTAVWSTYAQIKIEPKGINREGKITEIPPVNISVLLTDNEISHLSDLAREHGIPLIIDNAYGAPFPNIIFTEATPVWNEDLILTLSLSKLGLPGTRTGIVVGREEIISAIASMTSIIGLANPNLGQAILPPLVESGEVLGLSREVVRPFYKKKSQQAQEWVKEFFPEDLDYYVHRSEGALFLWLWFPGLPITSKELYQRLKARDVLVVPGDYFFFGLEDDTWAHRHECLRVTYTMPEEVVREGLRLISEEVVRAWQEAPAAG